MKDLEYAQGVGISISTASIIEEIVGEMSPEQRPQVEAHILIAIGAAFELAQPGPEHGRRLARVYDKNRDRIARYLASSVDNPDHPKDPKPVEWPTLEI